MRMGEWIKTEDGHLEYKGEEPIYDTYGGYVFCLGDPGGPECQRAASHLAQSFFAALMEYGYVEVIEKKVEPEGPHPMVLRRNNTGEDMYEMARSTVAIKIRVVHPERLKNPDWRPDFGNT